MPYSNEDGLIPLIKKLLEQSGEPMSCHEIYDLAEVRSRAPSANRVSDYLGHLWRKGVLSRIPAPAGTRARWLYQWQPQPAPSLPDPVPPFVPPAPPAVARLAARPHSPAPAQPARASPAITISEVDGKLQFTIAGYTVTIHKTDT